MLSRMACTCGKSRRCTKNTVRDSTIRVKGQVKCRHHGIDTAKGPIVRINPRELHVNDPYWYEEIYASGGRKREKDPRFVVVFAAPQSIFATVSHDHHRARRGILNSYFSKRSVTKLEPLIQEKVDKLAQRFEQAYRDGTILRLETVFAALSADIVTHYSYGTSYEYLDDENFKNSVSDAVSGLSAMIHINRFFPILFASLRKIPPWLIRTLHPSAADVIDLQVKIQQQSAESLQEKKSLSKSRETIFDALSDPKLPPEERTLDRLQDEGNIILLAGTEASARALSVAAFHLLNNRSLLLKLREELKQVMPTPTSLPNWNQLEALPYLVIMATTSLIIEYLTLTSYA
jgi:cytochrome P450